MELRLIYPDIPFWRAETSRLALFIGGIEFEDLRPSREEIAKMKTDGTFLSVSFLFSKLMEKPLRKLEQLHVFVENLADYILLKMNLQQQKSMKL